MGIKSVDDRASHGCPPPVATPDPTRRVVLAGLAAFPAAALLAGQGVARTAPGALTPVSIPLANGRTALGLLALPTSARAPALVVIHEWWGLNDAVKAIASDLAGQGYLVLAVDLFGKVAENAEAARQQVQGLDAAATGAAMVAAVAFLRGHERSTGKVGALGLGYGGAWALNAALATPIDAAVIYHGNVRKTADQLKSLAGPVLGHFGTLDRTINGDMVMAFEKAMKDAGKADRLSVYWYDADHAFANPSSARHDPEDAALAWERTMFFLRKHLG